MLVTMLPYSGTDAGGDSGHVQSWHLERNVVRWGCAQMHCGGDGEVQLVSSLPGRTWGSQDGAGRVGVSLFSDSGPAGETVWEYMVISPAWGMRLHCVRLYMADWRETLVLVRRSKPPYCGQGHVART